MNKIMGCMAYGEPAGRFDLRENRVSGGDTAIYVSDAEGSAGLARAEVALLHEPIRRHATHYVSVHRRLLGAPPNARTPGTADGADKDESGPEFSPWGYRYENISMPETFEMSLRGRTADLPAA